MSAGDEGRAPTPPGGGPGVRVDAWLWGVRVYATRSAATAACRAGHVRRGGDPLKASQQVRVGDEIRVRFPGRERVLEVRRLLVKRVGAPVAREAYVDLTPEPPPLLGAGPPRRDRGSGRPTKRERRALDRLRGRDGTRPGPEEEDGTGNAG